MAICCYFDVTLFKYFDDFIFVLMFYSNVGFSCIYVVIISFFFFHFSNSFHHSFNLFHATGLSRYLLKTPENLWFSDVFREYRKTPVAGNGLMSLEYLLRLSHLQK